MEIEKPRATIFAGSMNDYMRHRYVIEINTQSYIQHYLRIIYHCHAVSVAQW